MVLTKNLIFESNSQVGTIVKCPSCSTIIDAQPTYASKLQEAYLKGKPPKYCPNCGQKLGVGEIIDVTDVVTTIVEEEKSDDRPNGTSGDDTKV